MLRLFLFLTLLISSTESSKDEQSRNQRLSSHHYHYNYQQQEQIGCVRMLSETSKHHDADDADVDVLGHYHRLQNGSYNPPLPPDLNPPLLQLHPLKLIRIVRIVNRTRLHVRVFHNARTQRKFRKLKYFQVQIDEARDVYKQTADYLAFVETFKKIYSQIQTLPTWRASFNEEQKRQLLTTVYKNSPLELRVFFHENEYRQFRWQLSNISYIQPNHMIGIFIDNRRKLGRALHDDCVN